MHKSHKEVTTTTTAALDSSCARAEGPGAESTNNEYLSPALCVPLMCK